MKEIKKILICASRVSHIHNFHMPYIEYFKSRGFQVDIAVQGISESPLIDNCYNVKFTKNPFSPDNLHTVRLLKRIMRGLRKRPYYVHISHGYMFGEKSGLQSKIYLLAEKLTRNVTDSLVVMNKEDFSLAEKYKLGKKLYFIYGMGLVGERFPEISDKKRNEIRKSMGISESDKMLLCVGEFSKRKNQTAVIQALERLLKKHKNIKLVLAGDGDMLETCRKISQSLEIDRNICFLGQVKEISYLYRCSDVLVTASKMEGLPFNVMEALYCRVPVVATDIKGHSDLIENKKNGLLVSDIYTGLDEILSDENLYHSIKKNACLDERYLIENTKPELLKILDREYTEEVFA